MIFVKAAYKDCLLLILLILAGCANPMAPTGGPKDEDPPVMVSSSPENGTLNFHGNTIDMTFNEPIQVVALKNELIITPTYSGEYDFKSRKYGLTVEFEKPFNDSTTYTLNFRSAVKDVTESNPAENLILAFSTWGFLDSLSLSGKVYELLTDLPVKEYVVGIYAKNDTLTPFNSPPLYFSKTDEQGNYTLNNIKSDNYLIYTFNDKNDNLKIESKNEKYGFIGESILLDSSKYDLDIGVINLDLTELGIASARQNGQYFEIKATKYITDYSLSTPDSDSTLFSKYLSDHKGISLYNTFEIPDSLMLLVNLQDSMYNHVIDTIYIKYIDSNRKKDDFKFLITSAEINKDKRAFEASVELSKPLEFINFDSLYIQWDSTKVLAIDSSNIAFENNNLRLKIRREIGQQDIDSIAKSNLKPSLDLKPGAFISIENDSSLNKNLAIKITQTSELGIVKGVINLDSVSYFIQLIDEQGNIIRSVYNQKQYEFNDVMPSTYRLRLLIDQNSDGIWHPGNITRQQPPEPVFYYYDENGNQDLILRANWELIDIDVNSLNRYVEKEVITEEEN